MHAVTWRAVTWAADTPRWHEQRLLSIVAHLVKVGRQPVHDHVEGVVEGEVVDDDGPDCGVGEHAPPGGWQGAALLASLLGGHRDYCQPEQKTAKWCNMLQLCADACTGSCWNHVRVHS